MTITVRKNTRGITVRSIVVCGQELHLLTLHTQQPLAVLAHKCDESQEIELFDRAGEAASAASAAEDEKAGLAAHSQSQAATIKQLEQCLEELTEVRTEHENMLVQKFQALLNSKKLKIRDQQRLLDEKNASVSTGTVSPGEVISYPWRQCSSTRQAMVHAVRETGACREMGAVRDQGSGRPALQEGPLTCQRCRMRTTTRRKAVQPAHTERAEARRRRVQMRRNKKRPTRNRTILTRFRQRRQGLRARLFLLWML